MGDSGGLRRALQDFRLTYASIIRMPAFSVNIMKGVYRNYINHEKVIGWVNGYPVFSTLSPPALSKVQANMEARNAISMMRNMKHPNMLNLAVTDVCNCDCDHCSFAMHKAERKVLDAEQLKAVIRDAQDLGVCTITFTGGEPLARQDLPALVASVDKDRSVTALFTNGWLLERRARELKEAGLLSVNVSIDAPDAAAHDRLRHCRGLFNRALKGIAAAQKSGLLVGISTCMTQQSLRRGDLQRIIELGKRLKVNEVIVFDVIPTGKLLRSTEVVNSADLSTEINRIAEAYNRRYDYPGVYAYSYVRSYRGLGCAGGTTFFYMNPYGDVSPCDFNPTVIGNVLDTPLHVLWERLSRHEFYHQVSLNGCRMRDPGFRKAALKVAT